MGTDPGGMTIQPPCGSAEEDLARGYTVAHGRGDATERRTIPADILIVELRRLCARLERALTDDDDGDA